MLVPIRSPQGEEDVAAREFDLTQTAKAFAAAIPIVATAVFGLLEIAGVEDATDPAYVIAALGVTAVALLTLGLVASADILGRSAVEVAKRRAAAGEAATESPADATAAAAERKRLDELAATEREHKNAIASEERARLDRVAGDERKRKDQVAADERARLDRVAEDERKRKDWEAELERRRQGDG